MFKKIDIKEHISWLLIIGRKHAMNGGLQWKNTACVFLAQNIRKQMNLLKILFPVNMLNTYADLKTLDKEFWNIFRIISILIRTL